MKKIKPLSYKYLSHKVLTSQLAFKTTDQIKSRVKFIGQTRALAALNFGIKIKHKGYNLYAMGPAGIGKHSFVRLILEDYASQKPTPSDWCYLHNFDCPEKPIAVKLRPGRGYMFQRDMKILIEEIGSSILAVIESDDYRKGIEKINQNAKQSAKLADVMGKTTQICRKQHDKIKKLEIRLIIGAIKQHFKRIKKTYKKNLVIQKYLSKVKKDIITHINDFVTQDEKSELPTLSLDNPVLVKYKVNLLTDHRNTKGAPVIFEDDPSYSSLICRIEHTSELGSLTTNLTLIRPGRLHQANGGYLLVEARKLKKNSEAWDALKSCLYHKQIRIKPTEHDGDVRPVSLDPMPIPLSVKVILLGDRNTYYSLCQRDSDFSELFKVPVDFNEEINRNQGNINLYARLIATICEQEKLKPFNSSAVAAIIDYSSRLAEDNEKLSTHIHDIENLILESDYWTSIDSKSIVTAKHVKQALEARINRMDRAKELYYEDIFRHNIVINTHGKKIGQINCLSVRRVGNFSYGHPTRVSARVRLGHGKLIDIQREIKMAGPLHSKAGLIISNFLASRFAQDEPFSLTASIAFEQLYCWTDGDSASAGELCALLSALANVPIFQYLAITGSIDQYGAVQVVGGINEKIEGFFDICQQRGLTGKQGVVIPKLNMKNLMLKDEVVAAAKAHQFSIYPINHIDEAIELMTGIPSGQMNVQGHYPSGTIYYKIEKRLSEFSKNRFKIKLKL